MHLPASSLLATSLLLSSCSAASVISPPDRWIRYNLDVAADMAPDTIMTDIDIAHDDHLLSKRKQVKVCQALGAPAICQRVEDTVNAFSDGIARRAKALSGEHDCSVTSGRISGVTYYYHAEGGDCSTTAQEVTIAGAIEHHIKNINGGKLCQTECLNLSHGGTWNGYLLIGPTNGFDSSKYCGPKLGFGKCDSGGKKNFG